MSSEWLPTKLEDLTDGTSITYGVVKPGEGCAQGVPFVRGGDIVAGRVLIEHLRTITTEVSAQYSRTLLRGGELLISLVGNPGEVAIAPTELRGANIARQVGLIRIDSSKAEPNYVQYFLRSKVGRDLLLAHSKGSVQQVINLKDLKSIKVPLPSLGFQRAIAEFMQAIDDRIALLRETNATLEAIAQALFKSWFVDFDPVHAKQKGLPPPGMDEATAALFPDSFVASRLGSVPHGWTLETLVHTFDINPTRSLKKGATAPYLDMASLATSGHCVEVPVQRQMGSGAKFSNGDTLLARITPCLENGKSAFVDFLADDQIGWGSTEFVVLHPKAPLPEYLGYLLCRHPQFRDYAIQSMSGTSGRQRIQNDVLGRYLLALPDRAVALAFKEVVEPIQRAIAANHRAAQTIASLRDTLLPRLISGQLRLPEAQAQFHRAAL